MDREHPIELSVEAGPGDFRFRLDGVAIHVSIKAPGPPRGPAEGQARPALEPPPGSSGGEEAYYRGVSQEIYTDLGKLAKDINLSIQNLSLAELIHTGIASPGEHLDQARHQVADVLAMTEQATLNILDLVEQIRQDCQMVQSQLLVLGEARREPADEPSGGEQNRRWEPLLALAQELDRSLRGQDRSAAPEEGAPRQIPLGQVLQTILEFCGNETVKQHLKSVVTRHAALFRQEEAEAAIGGLAEQDPDDSGFLQLPVEGVLQVLIDCATDDRVRDLFTKMSSTAGKIFPLPTLPLESPTQEDAGPAPGLPDSGLAARWAQFYGLLRELAAAPTAGPAAVLPEGEGLPLVLEAQTIMGRINTALSRIMEHLSFQDLSGQRLQKLLKILRKLQVHVLTLLVALGNKLKTKLQEGEASLAESEFVAQQELDRLLRCLQVEEDHRLEAGMSEGEDGQPLNQDAINELLTSMGF
ncbi:MAG: hypothetical protein FJ128_08820 [Deltaproteobacteria bacterium]|nr:hypothetical protein [Deltaproteobacteria bacterium]